MNSQTHFQINVYVLIFQRKGTIANLEENCLKKNFSNHPENICAVKETSEILLPWQFIKWKYFT